MRENRQKCPKKAKMLIQGHVYPIFKEIEHFKCQKQILHRIWERIGGGPRKISSILLIFELSYQWCTLIIFIDFGGLIMQGMIDQPTNQPLDQQTDGWMDR